MTFLIPFIFAFVFMCFIVYFFLSLISDFVFGYKEWKIKRRYDNEASKAIAVLPLKWKEEKLQKWYVLIAIIFCGLVWMPSFVALVDVDNVIDMDNEIDNVIVNVDVIKIEEELSYKIPEPYYLDVEKGTKNISELREALKGIKYPHEYEETVFDCSEMSGYTERFLENRGFDTMILVNSSWRHAWISCSIESRNVNIECVPPVHITDSEKYNHPEDMYEDIYEALDSNYPRQFDWWLQV